MLNAKKKKRKKIPICQFISEVSNSPSSSIIEIKIGIQEAKKERNMD